MHKIVLGFDFGLKNIGVAIGQVVTKSANPLVVLKANRGLPNWHDIKKLIDEWGVDALIVGLPLNMNGSEQPITHKARAFADALKTRFDLPVYLTDERLTTIAAKEEMHARLKGSARFARADRVSAKLIVESWMNSD